MTFFKSLSLSISLLTTLLFITSTRAATIDIRNNCGYTVWAGAVPGGGRRLDRGQTWTINPPAGTKQARVWPRTGCNFNGAGQGRCQTGDCGGVLECRGYGQPPNTLAEYALNQYQNQDFIDISLVDGFNVPMEFSPTSGGCTRTIRCTADINGQCPNELRAPGGWGVAPILNLGFLLSLQRRLPSVLASKSLSAAMEEWLSCSFVPVTCK
ncbi:hypothetical protein C3L33_08570, partial [Rhododendron williamsianum]